MLRQDAVQAGNDKKGHSMPGKPTIFPAAQQAVDHLTSQAQEHISEVFTFAATTAVTALAEPDLKDPPWAPC